jgi:hypothetical protein
MKMLRIMFIVLVVFVFAACTPTTPTPSPPTDSPTDVPTDEPTIEPTAEPTSEPTEEPTEEVPTAEPTSEPTQEPTEEVPTDEPTGAFIPFDEFLQGVRDASFEDYSQRDGAQVRDEDAFEEMRNHILSMYDGVEQVSTFMVDDQYFDCITIDSQPSVRLLDLGTAEREAPDGSQSTDEGKEGTEPGTGEGLESPLTLGLTDAFGNPVACEDETIPMRRITLEEMTRFETLDGFFGKDPDGGGQEPPDPDPNVPPEEGAEEHKYAVARQYVTNYGGNSWLNLWNPTIGTDQIFSLSQQWYGTGSGDSTQTLEGGWQVFPQKYNTEKAVLFIYYTADNYKKTGCYNLDCAGFVQINKNWYIGGTWTQYSSTGGTQWGFEMQWKLYENNWWLFLKGPGNYEAVGYYPTSVYNGGQMSKSAERATYGGETAGKKNFPPMGSGAFANEGWQRAAFQNTIFYIPKNENDGVGVWLDPFEIEPSPDCYTIEITPASRGGNWGTYIFFGGPGGTTKC